MLPRPRRPVLAAQIKASAIGGGRRKADVVLMQPVLMLQLAMPAGHDGLATSEDLDDAHRGTAVRTDEGRRHDGERSCGR